MNELTHLIFDCAIDGETANSRQIGPENTHTHLKYVESFFCFKTGTGLFLNKHFKPSGQVLTTLKWT